MNKKALTITIVANMTSNYSESLGNIASVQKVFRNRKVYTIRSRESLKNAIMNTSGTTYIRNSSFYVTDAISCESFVSQPRFHNNLYMATNYAKENGLNVQNHADQVGLMPYQYEYDKSLKTYSITIDLEMVGKDDNFQEEAEAEEKAERVCMLLNAVETLSLIVKGNMDNAEPVFAVGGLSERKTHYFENVVHVKEDRLELSEDLIIKKNQGFHAALLKGQTLENEKEIEETLKTMNMPEFFQTLKEEVREYYGV